jgi:hypothetical protein
MDRHAFARERGREALLCKLLHHQGRTGSETDRGQGQKVNRTGVCFDENDLQHRCLCGNRLFSGCRFVRQFKAGWIRSKLAIRNNCQVVLRLPRKWLNLIASEQGRRRLDDLEKNARRT